MMHILGVIVSHLKTFKKIISFCVRKLILFKFTRAFPYFLGLLHLVTSKQMRIRPKVYLPISLISIILFVPLFSYSAKQFKDPKKDKLIISSVILQFQKECVHVYTIDKGTLSKVQEYFIKSKDRLTKEQKECFDSSLLKLQGIFTVYQQTCDEVTEIKNFENDADAARVFINIRHYLTSFKATHKLLNNCLTRSGIPEDDIIELSDYEVGAKQVFKKLREMDVPQPFREEIVHFR